MYLRENDIYISENENILFDLKGYRIFGITNSMREYLYNQNDKEENYLTKEELEILNEILIANNNDDDDAIEEGYGAVKIHVSNTCNLRCKYCYAKGGNYGTDSMLMNEKTAIKVVDFLKTEKKFENIEYITFFGGEPLLNCDIIEYICENTKDMNVKYLLQTNGTIVNSNIIRILKKYHIILTVSLDGPQYINDFNRIDMGGKGTYEKIVNNINVMRENDINVRAIEATLSREFIGKYSKKEIADYIYGITGAKLIKVEYDMSVQAKECDEELLVEIEHFFEQCVNGKYIVDNDAYRILKIFLSRQYSDYICPAGNSVITIDVQGNVFPCQFFVGLAQQKIDGVNNKKIMFNNMASIQKSRREECRNCSARRTCSLCIARGIKEEYCERNINLQKWTLEKFAEYVYNGKFDALYNNFSSL